LIGDRIKMMHGALSQPDALAFAEKIYHRQRWNKRHGISLRCNFKVQFWWHDSSDLPASGNSIYEEGQWG